MDDVSLSWYQWSCKVIVFLTVNWSLIYILLWLQRNYRFFYMFILTSTILCVYIFAFSWVNILEKDHISWKAMSEDVPSVILMVYCFIAVWFVGGLSVFHFYLICTNQVTFLLLKYIKELKKKSFFTDCFMFSNDKLICPSITIQHIIKSPVLLAVQKYSCIQYLI